MVRRVLANHSQHVAVDFQETLPTAEGDRASRDPHLGGQEAKPIRSVMECTLNSAGSQARHRGKVVRSRERSAAQADVALRSTTYSGEVVEIPVEALLAQLREMIELLAPSAGTQVSWLIEQRYPVDELALQLDDAVPAWFSRLRQHQLLPQGAATALVDLRHLLGAIRSAASLARGLTKGFASRRSGRVLEHWQLTL
jgi:hypothetical protein